MVVSVVALVPAIVGTGSNVYRGGDVTMGEFLICLSSLSSLSSLKSSDGVFSGCSKGGKSLLTGEGPLASLRTSAKS